MVSPLPCPLPSHSSQTKPNQTPLQTSNLTNIKPVARGSSVLAKSVTPSRIEANKTIIQLSPSDMQALENFSKVNGVKRFVYPEFGVNFGFPDRDDGMVFP